MIKNRADNGQADNELVACLKAQQATCVVIKNINKVLLVLVNKRPTVAEKAIQAELNLYASLEGKLVAFLTQSLIDGQNKYWAENDFRKLRQINIRLNKQLNKFNKAASYSLSYLEQYFEHDFWIELENSNFSEELYGLVRKLSFTKY